MALLSKRRSAGVTSDVGTAVGSQCSLLSVPHHYSATDTGISLLALVILLIQVSYTSPFPFLGSLLEYVFFLWLPCGKRIRLPSHGTLCFLFTSFLFLALISTCYLISDLKEEKTFLFTIPKV